MITIKQYDNTALVASNETHELYIGSYGKRKDNDGKKSVNNTRYIIVEKQSGLDACQVGEFFDNASLYVSNAFEYAIDCWGFKPEEVLTKYPRNTVVTLNEAQRVAINTALYLLGQSNSDHAEQAYFYLDSVAKQFNK